MYFICFSAALVYVLGGGANHATTQEKGCRLLFFFLFFPSSFLLFTLPSPFLVCLAATIFLKPRLSPSPPLFPFPFELEIKPRERMRRKGEGAPTVQREGKVEGRKQRGGGGGHVSKVVKRRIFFAGFVGRRSWQKG